MVVSTGMQSMETIRRVYNTVKEHNQNFTMLQCTSAYPLDPKDVNLKVIKVLCLSVTQHLQSLSCLGSGKIIMMQMQYMNSSIHLKTW